MPLSPEIARHLRNVYFGGNWTSVNLKDVLADVSWQEATAQVHGFNTIATLFHHCHYFVHEVLKVLQGGPLLAKDALSFAQPPIQNQEDWQQIQQRAWADAERFAEALEKLPDDKMWENFTDAKYGKYYSNLSGIIEHTHYHLGQMVLIKKIVRERATI